MTSDKSHVAFQCLTICEDENTKLHNAISSNQEEIIVENIENTNADIHKGIHIKYGIPSLIFSIDFF